MIIIIIIIHSFVYQTEAIVNSYIERNIIIHCWRDEFSNNAVFHSLPLRSPTIFLEKL
jgi:hypothetical protein